MPHWRIELGFVLLISGCASLAQMIQSEVPRLQQTHGAGLHRATSTEVPVVRPAGALYNEAAAVLAARCGIEREEPASWVAVSHWCYGSGLTSDRMRSWQTRTRVTLRVVPSARGTERFDLQLQTERREREPGEPASTPWRAGQPDDALRESLVASLAERVPESQTRAPVAIRFAEAASDAIQQLAAQLAPYSVMVADAEHLETDWRTSRSPLGDGHLEMRSRLIVRAGSGPDGTTLAASGDLQYRYIGPNREDPWSDLDPGPVVQHAWGVALAALTAHPVMVPEEAPRAFASTPRAEPALEDPMLSWVGAPPPGVFQTGSTAEVSLPARRGMEASSLLGRLFDSQFHQVQGRVRGIGQPLRHPTQAFEHRLREAELEWDIELTASAFQIASASIGYGTRQMTAIYEAAGVEETIALPEYVRFEGVSPEAAYYVSGVRLGRAYQVFIRGNSEAVRGALGASAGQYAAEIRARHATQQLSIEVAAIGFEAPHLTQVLSAEEVRGRVLAPGTAQPIQLVLQRVPDAVRGNGARVIDVIVTSVEVPNQNPRTEGPWDTTPFGAWNDPDMTVFIGGQPHECADDTVRCAVNMRFNSLALQGGALPLRIDDRDPFSNVEPGPEEQLSIVELVAGTPRERMPIGFVERTHAFPSGVVLTLRLRER